MEKQILTLETTKGKKTNYTSSLTQIVLIVLSRFLDITLTGRHNITSGKIYQTVSFFICVKLMVCNSSAIR